MRCWPTLSPRCWILHALVRFEAILIPSRRLLMLALLSHFLLVVVLTLLLSGWRGVAMAWLAVLLGVLQWLHRYREGGAEVVSGIRHDGSGWAFRCGDTITPWQQAQLLGPVFCHRHLVVLRFRRQGRRLPEAIAITHDSCSSDEFRRLRVLARHLPAPQLWAASP